MSQEVNQTLELRVLELLEEFEDKLEASTTVPLTGKILVDRDDLMTLLKEINELLPDEYQHVRWIKSQKDDILDAANETANAIRQNAEIEARTRLDEAEAKAGDMVMAASVRANELVESHEIVRRARQKAEAVIAEAENKAEGIRSGTYEYAEEVMKRVSVNLSKVLHTVEENIEELQKFK